ncbi:MAG: hypothetical protein KDC44_20035, partial [Phaeodactylibacter sp.]|nr:hypothetical protein [Phaeodactylibacter sp.]
RLPNVILSLGLGTLTFVWGRKLFGGYRMTTWLMILVSTLLFSNLQKFASGDLSLAWFQLLAFLAFLRYLKQPGLNWLLFALLFTGLAVWANPFQSFVWSIGLFGALILLHKDRKKILFAPVWLLPALACAVLLALGKLEYSLPEFYLGLGGDWDFGRQYLLQLIGVLPWIGFVVPGLWELQKRLRKGEELAVLQFAALLAGLLNPGLFLAMALALLAMRQVADYAHPNYPNRSLARTFAIAHLLLVFVLGVVSMIWGFSVMGGIGFRSFMAVMLPYWIASFLTVSGMVGLDARYYIGAPAMAGLLFTATVWIQLGPILENRRNLPEKLSEYIQKDPQFTPPLHIQLEDQRQSAVYAIYAEKLLGSVIIYEETPSWSGTYLLDSLNREQLKQAEVPILLEQRFENWEGLAQKQPYWLISCGAE